MVLEPICNDKLAKAYDDIKNILEENLIAQQRDEFNLQKANNETPRINRNVKKLATQTSSLKEQRILS